MNAKVCESCGALPGTRHSPTQPEPTLEELEEYVYDSVVPATDGCSVEPDGRCAHGHMSWLLEMGLI